MLSEVSGGVRLQIDRSAISRTVEESVGAARTYWSRLRDINCPVAILVGTGSDWTPLGQDDVQRYVDSLSAPVVELVPGGHDLGIRTNRAPLYAALSRLLREAASI
jgi:pimeloyl-ACP methyl ester carboxylesterase